jgi:hypothetical protein
MLIKKLSYLLLVVSVSLLAACGKKDEVADSAVTEEVIVVEEAAEHVRDILVMAAETAVETTAVVEAIDHETRVVTLRGEDDESVTLTAPAEAHNLDQVQVGDTITAVYIQRLDIELVEVPEGTEPAAAASIIEGRAEKGDTPAGGIMTSQVLVAIVEDINLENNTFKLRGPEGEVNEYTAQNPENLKLAEVGDAVVITLTEAVGVSLTEKAGEETATEE